MRVREGSSLVKSIHVKMRLKYKEDSVVVKAWDWDSGHQGCIPGSATRSLFILGKPLPPCPLGLSFPTCEMGIIADAEKAPFDRFVKMLAGFVKNETRSANFTHPNSHSILQLCQQDPTLLCLSMLHWSQRAKFRACLSGTRLGWQAISQFVELEGLLQISPMIQVWSATPRSLKYGNVIQLWGFPGGLAWRLTRTAW